MSRIVDHKILQIGNYPPPLCGWAIQTKMLADEIRRRGAVCDVLNLSENRRIKSPDYVDVQGGFDYVFKLLRFAARGYRFQVHSNGQDVTGYLLALLAALVGRAAGRPVSLAWRGGAQQKYFPRQRPSVARFAFQVLFHLSGRISCNNAAVKQAIEKYGIEPARVAAIPGFSTRHLEFQRANLPSAVEVFLESHSPVFFCYVSFRPEYRLEILREAMRQFRDAYPQAGFIWLGFPAKELPAAREFAANWPVRERDGLLMLGNLPHDQFLTLLTRCTACVRTPECDGVSASVLESVALGIPVVASENGHRPLSVTTYRGDDAADLCAKLADLTANYAAIKQETRPQVSEDNIARTVDWLLADAAYEPNDAGRRMVRAVE